jgi:predicted alpha/beta hydrolase family esterase
VAGALLVAPPEAEHSAIDHRLAGFAPVPAGPLPFPAILAASRNDPYMAMRMARRLAANWGATFADAGAIGHINAQSGIADWPFGLFLLGRLLKNTTPSGRICADAPAQAGEVSRLAHVRETSPAPDGGGLKL